MKKITLLLFSFSLINNIIAQNNSFEKLVTVGISQPILNNGTGFHIGFNPSFELTKSFSIDGQLSHIYTNIDSYFLSGDYGRSNDLNLLIGGRLYLNSKFRYRHKTDLNNIALTKEKNPNRFFINLLLGLNYERDDRLGREIREEYRLGFSIGGYYRFKKINFGLTYDSHHIVLKCGYLI